MLANLSENLRQHSSENSESKCLKIIGLFVKYSLLAATWHVKRTLVKLTLQQRDLRYLTNAHKQKV